MPTLSNQEVYRSNTCTKLGFHLKKGNGSLPRDNDSLQVPRNQHPPTDSPLFFPRQAEVQEEKSQTRREEEGEAKAGQKTHLEITQILIPNSSKPEQQQAPQVRG